MPFDLTLLSALDDTIFNDSPPELYTNPFLVRDLRNMTMSASAPTTRDIVRTYYDLQDLRVLIAQRAQDLSSHNNSYDVLQYYAAEIKRLESGLLRPMLIYAKSTVPGRWALAQHGIGPVFAAGLVAHIDITRAPTAGSVWRYAGLDPTNIWSKGSKRPWNPDLKNLSWKIGQSFMRLASHDDCYYGKLYLADKLRRTNKNKAGDYADAAQTALQSKDWNDATARAILESGHLPDSQIDAQARRFAVKIFLSHYHAVAYQDHHGLPAPRPYIIDHGDRTEELTIPHFPF